MQLSHYLAYGSFVVRYEIGKCGSSKFVLHFQDGFGYLRTLAFPFQMLDYLVSFRNSDSWVFDRDYTESTD